MRYLLSILTALLFAAPAFAIDAWVNEPGAATQTFPCDFQQSRVCYWDVTEAGSTDVTTVLDARVCENVSAKWYNNIAAATFNNLASVYDNGGGNTIHASDHTAEKVKDQNLTGDPSTSKFAIYGFDADKIYVKFTMVDVGSTGRIGIHCHPRGGN